ncbi:S8 family serine peptidase [Microtetraspora fusca]|uniref:S8 family serine peptidase n=1 Tax=Microtetraspora fusca TaxID=1997 RepID=A0ABW6V7J7_MICFU
MARNTRRASAFGAMALAAAVAITAAPTPASADPLTTGPLTAGPTGSYIVTLAEQPLTTYQGGVDGIAATKPGKGRKVDTGSANAKRYRDHLKSRQNQVAQSVGARPGKQFSVAVNSFVADLTPAQALRLHQRSDVISVEPNELLKPTNDRNSTDFLKLSGENGLWSTLGGTANAGKGIVVGVIDTGIWPENPSFAAPALDAAPPTDADPYRPYLQGETSVMKKADGGTFTGTCQTGEQFTANLCNQKVISARYFGDAWMSMVPPEKRADYASPRDAQGHGSHTASTAAGDTAVKASANGIDFGEISGVAPGAAIAVYKALWQGADDDSTGGATSDLVAAIDQAVADGVDVINYSVGGSQESSYYSSIQLAFRSAAAAGIFVATAGGNSGPDARSLDNTMPWTTTVAASTIAPYQADVELGNGARYRGSSTSVVEALGPKPLATALSVKNAAATDADARLCSPDTLDPAKTAGKIILCERGVIARVAKSAEVKRAGGVGMVLANTSKLDTDGDLHAVPTVHVDWPDAKAVLDYAGTDGATVTLLPAGSDGLPYPQVADFSSRGPSITNNGDLLKPDIAAPGVNILAAVSPTGNDGKDFDFYSGTSMATPHVAGLAALYLAKHPAMSPAAIKSAMMTTAVPTKAADGTDANDPFAQGAGHVVADAMFDPGLVYDATDQDWLGYLKGLGYAWDTTGAAPIATSDLNYPTIAVSRLLGGKTVTRRVTALTPGVYHAKVDLPGIKAKVTPSTLNFKKAGETKEFAVTMELAKDASADVLTVGSLTWTGAGKAVRSTVVVTPQSALAPAVVRGTGTEGSVSFEVTPAVKHFPVTTYGMVSGPLTAGSAPADGGYTTVDFTVPAGAKAVEVTLRADDPRQELGGIVYLEENGAYAYSSWLDDNGGSAPGIVIQRPKAGTYTVIVVAMSMAETPFTAQANVVTQSGGAGTLTVSPKKPTVTPGVPVTYTATWSGVPEGRHTGYIEYPNGAGTVISVN